MPKMTSIFFATDLHGSESCFKKFLRAADFYKVSTLIMGGDISGKVVVPLVEQHDGTFRVDFVGAERTVNTRRTS